MEQSHDTQPDVVIPNVIAQAISHSANLISLTESVLEHTLGQLGLHAGWVYLYDVHANAWRLASQRQVSSRPVESQPPDDALPAMPEYPGQVGATRTSQPDAPHALRLGAMIVVPLMSQGQVLGVMELASLQAHNFTLDEQALLRAIGQELGMAIAKIRAAGPGTPDA
jgi:GAF domain-containing protein